MYKHFLNNVQTFVRLSSRERLPCMAHMEISNSNLEDMTGHIAHYS